MGDVMVKFVQFFIFFNTVMFVTHGHEAPSLVGINSAMFISSVPNCSSYIKLFPKLLTLVKEKLVK